MTLAELAARFRGPVKRDARGLTAFCPGHADGSTQNRPSLRLTETPATGGLHLHCWAGCDETAILAAAGLTLADLTPAHRRNGGSGTRPGGARLVAAYDYYNTDGSLAYQVVRFDPKDFRQRRPDASGGWRWDMKGQPRLLYGLPDLQAAPLVYVVEGEKDADALRALGLVATTSTGGSTKWTPSDTAALLTADVKAVAIVPDNDAPGEAHAQKVSASCRGAGLEVRIVRLPGLGPKEDVSDWLAAGHTRDDLEALVAAAPLDSAAGGEPTDGRRAARAVLNAGDHDLPRATAAAWAALALANNPPRLFRYGGGLTRLLEDEHGVPQLVPLTVDAIRHELARAGRWVVMRAGAERDALPPLAVCRDLLADPEPQLPVLARITEAPYFTAAGSLHSTPGYDPVSHGLYVPASGFTVPAVPKHPTPGEVGAAALLLADSLLGDFPFTGPAERAHALAALLLPYGRELVEGPAPLHLIEKNAPGTGATLLASVIALLATGRPLEAHTLSGVEEELRKALTAALLGAPSILAFDNLSRRVDSAALSAVLTTGVHSDRRLGASEMVVIPVRALFLASGNNPSLSAELTRRTVRIRLDAKMERPWLREPASFRHADLPGWVRAERGRLVAAALTLIQAWLVTGRPPGPATLGMYESWARTMGGILLVAGVDGFLGNLDSFYAAADPEGRELLGFLGAWWRMYKDAPVKVAELLTVADNPDVALDLSAKSEQGRRVRLGRLVASLRDRRYTLEPGLTVTVKDTGEAQRAVLWALRCESRVSGESDSLTHAFQKDKGKEYRAGERDSRDSQTHLRGMFERGAQ